MKQYNIYGIGNAIMDLQLQVSEADFQQLGVVKGGVRLVDVQQQSQILKLFDRHDIHQTSGGSAANTMIALAQLGAKTAYGCVVGIDVYGEFYREEMNKLGVVLHCAGDESHITGTCVILITPDAERTMNTHLGASALFGPGHVSEQHLSQAEWLYIEGYLFSSPLGREAISKAISMAKQHGVKIAITFSDAFIVTNFHAALRKAVADADLVFANFKEAQAFVGAVDEQTVFSKFSESAPNAIMTMTERGVHVSYDGKRFHTPAFSVTAVDETGAGDSFAGAFLYGITHHFTPEHSAELACFLASRVVSQLGPRLRGNVHKIPGIEKWLNNT